MRDLETSRGRRAGVVVDPALPAEVADILRVNPTVLAHVRAGHGPPESPEKEHAPVGLLVFGGVLAAVSLLIVLWLGGGLPAAIVPAGALGWFLIAAIRAAGDADEETTPEWELYDLAYRYRDHCLLPEELDDLDGGARRLLDRTRQAVGSVLRSRVNTDGLLDDVRNTVMLPHQEWEIARLLAKLSTLRKEHRHLVHDGVTPEVAAVVRPLERALAGSQSAVTARVEALERYAAHVADAERAYRARTQIEAFVERLPRYEELLAESGADALSIPELGHLAGEADELERALRASIGSAHEIFGHLDGPEAPDGPQDPGGQPSRQ
ncbi:hypothetical protein ACLQ2R_03505 [Streptosporangium sp. DT93]|uniref:hypothetical protein n=1 Tax=Streptosporangium sp. DT93 TaxID=3393428 RepID=UPI003CF667A9